MSDIEDLGRLRRRENGTLEYQKMLDGELVTHPGEDILKLWECAPEDFLMLPTDHGQTYRLSRHSARLICTRAWEDRVLLEADMSPAMRAAYAEWVRMINGNQQHYDALERFSSLMNRPGLSVDDVVRDANEKAREFCSVVGGLVGGHISAPLAILDVGGLRLESLSPVVYFREIIPSVSVVVCVISRECAVLSITHHGESQSRQLARVTSGSIGGLFQDLFTEHSMRAGGVLTPVSVGLSAIVGKLLAESE